jgi:CheY-like chemotaxis protein
VRGGTILLVEDNPDDEEMTLRTFEQSGIVNDVFVAHDGQEALDFLFGEGVHAARKQAPPPAVIILDLRLPKVGGLEVLRRLRADQGKKHWPVVVLTSSDEEKDMVSSYEFGANSYVRKPVRFEEFSRAVAELGRYWVMVNERPSE